MSLIQDGALEETCCGPSTNDMILWAIQFLLIVLLIATPFEFWIYTNYHSSQPFFRLSTIPRRFPESSSPASITREPLTSREEIPVAY